MKQFLQVFRFELVGLAKGKWFRISTILISVLIAIMMFLPRFIDMGNEKSADNVSQTSAVIGVYDPSGVFQDQTILKSAFPKATLKTMDSQEQLEKAIKDKQVERGFYIKDAATYEYMILDSSMNDTTGYILENIMSTQYRAYTLGSMGLDATQISKAMNTSAKGETTILGKDGKQNYFYTYILIFMLYFVIIFYGQLTATNVASEKGNRAMEILVTSTSSNALIFGKVLAGALAGIIQVGVILGTSMLAYQANVGVWNHALDFLFNIPANVLVTFAIFGTLGYLFYSFIYGALGSMVSKVEDVSSAISPIMIIFVISFFITFMSVMSDPNTLLSGIASYVPFTSCMAMFARVAMGSVDMWQVVLSAFVLALSTALMGILGAKLYRHGTLSYGNSFKFKNIIQIIKRKKER